jgi:hypothetical protein
MASLILSMSSMASQKSAKKEVDLKELLAKANGLELKKGTSKTQLGEKKEEADLNSASNSLINVNDSGREQTDLK